MITEIASRPRFDLSFFKKFSGRRALQELGPNDPKLNMKVAESLLTISAERFKRKWNFDPIAMKPTKGPFVWTPLAKTQPQQESCSRIPSPEPDQSSSRLSDAPSAGEEGPTPKNYQKSTRGGGVLAPRRCPRLAPSKSRQRKITGEL